MFLFHPIHFLKFLLKSQPQSSYKKGVTTLTVIVPAQLQALASPWFLIRDLAVQSICEVYEKRGC